MSKQEGGPTTVAELVPWLGERFEEAARGREAIRDEMREGFAAAAEDRSSIRDEMREGFRKVVEIASAIDGRLAAIEGAVEANRADIEKLQSVVDFQRGGLA